MQLQKDYASFWPFVEDNILARPRLSECRDALFCSVKGLRGLYETRASFAPQLEDAKGQTQPDSKLVTIYRGAVGRLSHESGVLGAGYATYRGDEKFHRV